MKQILKTLKKFWIKILFIIVLLFCQAMCDLSLPDYTAKIVNVGIGQNGIRNSTLEVVRKTELEKMFIFMTEEQKTIILKNYQLINKDNEYQNYKEKYPLLKKEDLYILKDVDEEKENEISKILEIPLLITSTLSSNQIDKEQLFGKNGVHIPSNIDIFTILSSMDKKQIKEIRDKFEEEYEKMGDSMITQMSVAVVKNEYETIGVDIEKIQINYIIMAGIRMILLALVAMIITIITTYLSSQIGAKFSKELRSKVVNKVMKYSNKEFEDFSTASLITRSTNDIQQVQMLVVMMLRIVIYAPIIGIGALLKVSGNSLLWIIGVAILSILSIIVILFAIAMPKFKVVQSLVDKLNLVSREILTGLPVIRAFSNEKYEEQRFDKANKELTKVNLFTSRVMTVMMPTMMFIMNGVSILIIWVGADKVDVGTLQVGDLLAFITYTMQIIMSFLMIAMMSIILPRSMISVKRIGEIFNKDTSVIDIKKPKRFGKDSKGIIEFRDVYFRYPDAEEDVIRNISFKAVPGTTTAFIGSTGSGKSTLINLIPRFFDVTGGKILIDGLDIKEVSLKNLRSRIGYVPQKGILFSGTIESNIKFGNSSLTKEEMKEVAKVSQSLEFIIGKEDNFKSEISQGGTNVSGGQKQRLAIARAIATNPDIYIFDDSFSALDYKTDVKLRHALKKYTKNSTILIVAQRISTVLNADQIIVLDEGEIVGIGTHNELMKNCEVYKEIALSQLSEEELKYE